MTTAVLSPTLTANLRALAERDRTLALRLTWPAASEHVRLRREPTLVFRGTELPLGVAGAALAPLVRGLPADTRSVLVLGVGLGEVVARLLEARPALEVVAWERDPWLLRTFLAREDVSRDLEAGRLRLALGVDLLELLEEQGRAPRPLLPHPVLGAVYAVERRLLEPRPADPSAGTRAADDAPWAALGTGGLFVDDLADALSDEGYRVLPVELERWSREELEHTLRRLRPWLVAAVNYVNGLAELCRERDLPFVVWEVDPTPDRAPRLEGPAGRARVFTYRAEHVPTWRAAGFAEAEHLPLAANVLRRRPPDLAPDVVQRYAAPAAFVGASLVENARAQRRAFLELFAAWHPDGGASMREADRQVQEVLDLQREDYATYRVPALAHERFGDFLSAMERRGTAQDPVIWLAEVAAAEKRLLYVATLGERGLHVWGDDGWRAVEPHGTRWRGPAGHRRELNRIYAAAQVNVDVNRLYQPDIVTMRVFDVLACGGFLVAEHSDELAELFRVGAELESYRTLDELVDKVAHYQDRPDAARRIAERGLAAVRERHTIRGRVRRMLEGVSAASSAGPRPGPD